MFYNNDYEKFIKNIQGFSEDLYSRGLRKGTKFGAKEIRSVAGNKDDGLITFKELEKLEPRVASEFKTILQIVEGTKKPEVKLRIYRRKLAGESNK